MKECSMKPKTPELSLVQQNYIETIYYLCSAHGHAHVKNIADKLNIKMASVTEAMQGLKSLGIVNYAARQNITLTAPGSRIAEELSLRHSTLASFYHEILGCSINKANEIACRVEHVIDPEYMERLAGFVKFIKENMRLPDGSNPVLEFKKKYENSACRSKSCRR